MLVKKIEEFVLRPTCAASTSHAFFEVTVCDTLHLIVTMVASKTPLLKQNLMSYRIRFNIKSNL